MYALSIERPGGLLSWCYRKGGRPWAMTSTSGRAWAALAARRRGTGHLGTGGRSLAVRDSLTPGGPRSQVVGHHHLADQRALHLAGQCIRQHGIPNFPDPTVASFDKRALRAAPSSVANQALTACRTALAQAGISLGGPNPQVTTQQQIQRASCLGPLYTLAWGTELPRPEPHHRRLRPPPGISFPQLLAAARACRPLVNAAGLGMPTPGNPPGSGT